MPCGRWRTGCLLLPVTSVALELSCQGYRYNDIDWDHVRTTLETYADKYLDRPQLLADVLLLASDYGLGYHPDNECVLGDLSLRFLLWLRFDEATLQAAATALASGPPQNQVEHLLHETYNWFWDLKLGWSEIMTSGWPLFSVMAAAASRMSNPARDPCVPAERLALYVESFTNAIYVTTSIDVATLLEASHCPDAVASALVSIADTQRATSLAQQNRYYAFTSVHEQYQPPEQDSAQLLARAEGLLRQQRSWELLTSPWPVWRLLDRLSAADVVKVTSGANSFWMHVFPHRVRSDGIISNRIRATQKAYCLQLFQDEVVRLAAQTVRPLRLVEAGPHIGDCMLWASATLQDRVKGLAVEPVPQVVSLFRKSIAQNGFDIALHHAWLGASYKPPSSGSSVPWLRLDSLLAEDIDVLKIHTNGGERAILDGSSGLFMNHQVRVVIVHSAEPDQLWQSSVFLLERGYAVTVDGRRLTVSDEAWLREEVSAKGGLQLHAVH